MDFTKIMDDLEDASLFDLYRLGVVIGKETEDPARIQQVKVRLHIGQQITWFDTVTNRLEHAVVRKLLSTRCEVLNASDGKVWRIFYASINLDDVDTTIHSSQKRGIKKSALGIGDRVAFVDKSGQWYYATVTKLNPKTAGLVTTDGQQWRVSYGALYRDMEVEGRVTRDDPALTPGDSGQGLLFFDEA